MTPESTLAKRTAGHRAVSSAAASYEEPPFTVVVPCYNESGAIEATIRQLHSILAPGRDYQLLVVDDGSNDGSTEILDRLVESGDIPELVVIHHSKNSGYGSALKTGVRRAAHELIVITDADATYPNDRIPDLVAKMTHCDMVVGARTGENVDYPFIRKVPKSVLVGLASWMAGQQIPDMNSGLRVFRKSATERFLNILSDGFSFTTTITLAMLLNNYQVVYTPIDYRARVGESKIRPIHDTLRFVQLILRAGMYFAPLRVLGPLAIVLWLAFFGKFGYDVIFTQNVTDSSLLLFLFSMNTVMFALLADMIDKRS